MIDCIASYHLNPWTCGIAKFNRRLATEMGVPLVPILGLEHTRYTHPLVSINPAEFSQYDRHHLATLPVYDLFLHGFDPTDRFAVDLIGGAARVLVGNRALSAEVRQHRPDVVLAWCPSTIPLCPERTDYTWRILTFGMAHKLDASRYVRLREVLEASHHPYRIDVSTALHERTPWEDALPELEAEMRAVFGERVRLLGNLSDASMSQALTDADALAAFFPEGVRANNTTVWAAIEHGCPVITNLDARSPLALVHGQNVFNIDELTEWPTAAELQHVRANAWAMYSAFGWKELMRLVRAA